MSSEFAEAVRDGLSAARKSIPPKWFYDEKGSRLYEKITRLPEYYLTRADHEILRSHAGEIIREAGGFADIVELGSGSSSKTRHILDALDGRPVVYHAIDISPAALDAAMPPLAREFRNVETCPHVGEFVPVIRGIREHLRGDGLWLFLGSTIGNLSDEESAELLDAMTGAMAPGGRFMLGVDLIKDVSRLEAAYDDSQGVTAEFNLNLLERINRELGGDFDLSKFEHRAFFDTAHSRIEMHLESSEEQTIAIRALGITVRFAEGERIHTENCRKYNDDMIHAIADSAGMRVVSKWTDPNGWFAQFMLARA